MTWLDEPDHAHPAEDGVRLQGRPYRYGSETHIAMGWKAVTTKSRPSQVDPRDLPVTILRCYGFLRLPSIGGVRMT